MLCLLAVRSDHPRANPFNHTGKQTNSSCHLPAEGCKLAWEPRLIRKPHSVSPSQTESQQEVTHGKLQPGLLRG